MLKTLTKLYNNLNTENQNLKAEVIELKQKLQYRHTTISDLRYAKRELEKKLQNN